MSQRRNKPTPRITGKSDQSKLLGHPLERRERVKNHLLRDAVGRSAWTSGWYSNLTEFEGKPLASVRATHGPGQARGQTEKKNGKSGRRFHEEVLHRQDQALARRAGEGGARDPAADPPHPPALVSEVEHDIGGDLRASSRRPGRRCPSPNPSWRSIPATPWCNGSSRRKRIFPTGARCCSFDQALLAEGGHLEDPAGFVKRLNELMLALSGNGPNLDAWKLGRPLRSITPC